MVTSITEVLNIWNQMGVFSYVIPFLLIFAVVFAILKKTGILGDQNDGILAIIAVAIGLLALQLDIVSQFFAVIFPRFGVGISIFLVLIILLGFFIPMGKNGSEKGKWIGFAVGIGVVIWALTSWTQWGDFGGVRGWVDQNFWALVILGGIVAAIWFTVGGGSDEEKIAKLQKRIAAKAG